MALVAYAVAGTTIQIKDLDSRLSSLESEKGGNRAARSYLQEFEALVDVSDAICTKSSESLTEVEDSVYQNTSGTVDKTKNRLSNILPNQAFRPVLTAEAHREDTYINAVLVPNMTQDSQDILTQLPLPSTVTDFWRLVYQYDVGLIVAFETESNKSDETIAEFLPKSATEPFENDRHRVETRPLKESKYVDEFKLIVERKVVPGMDSSAAQTKKTLTLLQCKNTKLDPEAILEVQEEIRNCRPSGKSRVVYMCRNGADQCGLACVQSILLDRLDADECLVVPLVVGTIKAIRPQIIPTVDQYKCLYRVLRLAHESQNVYGNVG
ncbi:receptor-type tyrosine-protein phosphatase alpha-like [Elysia marginata]|uniref:Receptor-type tyrosine-protein phosphatase alpha-like n=1 Tax=Elysia marginata TaxID=1093978 RepID=A0AAV4IVZ0_9GAST|nr:receptor-type tyrosine-protein phosphatase alpha-like [Elysia marginata]